MGATTHLPLIDVSVVDGSTGRAIDQACRDLGFFRIVGHDLTPHLLDRLDRAARAFFALPAESKQEVAMSRSGRAWRGWFPLGGELTSGRPDQKEGFYVGTEHAPDHPHVRAGTPLHGPNLFPAEPADLGPAILEALDAFTTTAVRVMQALALGLGLPATWFEEHLTADPTVLFRIFSYPPSTTPDDDSWGVGEHTDYGLLTLLAQDASGGLQVYTRNGWLDVPAEPHVLVCNLGDMLERLTGGRYRSTPHRVRNVSGRDRLSFPFFFDPTWDARVVQLPLERTPPADPGRDRWDSADVLAWEGTYGDYLTAKVSKVFPELFRSLEDQPVSGA
jgi:isopenicillin N synthase-like dioxygenase